MAESVDYERLVQQFNRGDESAFETIVEQYSAEVALLANRLLGWRDQLDRRMGLLLPPAVSVIGGD